jgi:Fic family protein
MLAGVGETIPNPHLLIAPFMRREAVLSSRIEGTQASLSDLFMYEASGKRRIKGDVVEVANYVQALEHGLTLLNDLPICVRLMNEVHMALLKGVRGDNKHPGELRNDIVWIGSDGTALGEARFVPPPPHLVRDLMEDLERFANENLKLPPLVQCALLHYQFETIHPYLDGNGRTGRLLITLFLCFKGMLPKPLLYLSAYFERNRQLYYDQLFNVSATGDWEAWLSYFFQGVAEQSRDAIERIRRVRELQDSYRLLLQERHETANGLRLADELFASPFLTVPEAARILDVTQAGARGIIQRLCEAGIVEELESSWPRLYVALELLGVLDDAHA